MNKLVWISTIFVVSTFLITNTHSFSSAYGCSKSSNTNHTSSFVTGTSDNTTTRPSASATTSHISTLALSQNPTAGGETVGPVGHVYTCAGCSEG